MHTVTYTLSEERVAMLEHSLSHLMVMFQSILFSEEEKGALAQLVNNAKALLQRQSELTFRFIQPKEFLGNKAKENVYYKIEPICSEIFRQGGTVHHSTYNVILISMVWYRPEMCLPDEMHQQDVELIFPLSIELLNHPFMYICIGRTSPSAKYARSTFQVQFDRSCQVDDNSHFVCLCN